MGDGTKRMDGEDTRQAGKRIQSLRSLLHSQPVEFVPVPAIESDHWLQADTGASRAAAQRASQASTLHAYVERALEIGMAIQKNRASVPAQRPGSELRARAPEQARRMTVPPPPPPARRSTPGAGLPHLDAPPQRPSVLNGPTAATLGRLRAQEQSQRLAGTTGAHAPVHDTAIPQQPVAAPSRAHEQELLEARQQLQQAFVRVRQQQAMLTQAERRARSAEEWIKRHSQVNPPAQLSRRSRLLRHASALLVFFIAAFVVGGYISLLGPVRQRVLMHEAALRELGASQQQLTHQNQALLQQLAQSSSAAP